MSKIFCPWFTIKVWKGDGTISRYFEILERDLPYQRNITSDAKRFEETSTFQSLSFRGGTTEMAGFEIILLDGRMRQDQHVQISFDFLWSATMCVMCVTCVTKQNEEIVVTWRRVPLVSFGVGEHRLEKISSVSTVSLENCLVPLTSPHLKHPQATVFLIFLHTYDV